MSSGFDDLPSVQRARLRARGRVRLQKMDLTEADLPEGVTLEGVGCISPPDEWLPYEATRAIARGRQLAKRYGW